jgi:DNA polymerase III subunit delta'
MSFSSFHGNRATVTRLREMLARDRFPHGVVLAGPRGAGKFTLAQMLARAMNCLEKPLSDGLPDFCGHCANCTRIAQADDLDARCAEAVEAREALRDTDKRETRLFVQTHPDVLIIPPDPPQMMIKIDQVRHVTAGIYYRPSDAREKVYIFTDSAFMKEAANALLRVLEEPPEYATIFLLTENPGELLPTLRSRCVTVTLAPLAVEEIEQYAARSRPELNSKQRSLVARLSGGAVGRLQGFDLAAYIAARSDALGLLEAGVGAQDHTALFRITETYRAGVEGRDKTEQLIRTLYLLLEDLLFLNPQTPAMVRNIDIQPQLQALAQRVDFAWIARTSQQLGEVERGMRRNLLRSLSLDAFAVTLEQ